MFRSLAIAAAVASFTAPASADAGMRLVHAFQSKQDGVAPVVEHVSADGTIYGFTIGGGLTKLCSGCGTIFKMTPSGKKTVLHAFNGSPGGTHSFDGATPTGLAVDDDGTIYGTTQYGGRHSYGSVFKLTPDGTLSLLYSFPKPQNSFTRAPNGLWPIGGVLLARDGNLYGTASYGGINNHCGEGGCGTVFRVTKSGVFTLLYAFKGEPDGCHPFSTLIEDAQGMLVGTTDRCQQNNLGTVFKIDPATGAETVLHTFRGGDDGQEPAFGLVMDGSGNLYGGTDFGGSTCNGIGCGIVYKLAPDGTETILHVFRDITEGLGVHATLSLDRHGNLFGLTTAGGQSALGICGPFGCGTLFKLKPNGRLFKLHDFYNEGDDPGGPYYHLVAAPGGHKFYGTTQSIHGGCCGSVYELSLR